MAWSRERAQGLANENNICRDRPTLDLAMFDIGLYIVPVHLPVGTCDGGGSRRI